MVVFELEFALVPVALAAAEDLSSDEELQQHAPLAQEGAAHVAGLPEYGLERPGPRGLCARLASFAFADDLHPYRHGSHP